jgi:hypothetical protein
MVVRRIACWSLAITMLFAVSAAVAQTDSPVPGAGGAKLRLACGGDLQRFCVGVQPGKGRFIQCLSSHTRELSAACGDMIAARGGGAKIRVACGQDVPQFCAGVQPGGGRLVQCLSSHTHEVSAACGNMIAAIHARRDIPGPSAQSPVAQPVAPVTVGNPPVTMGNILRASCGPDVQRLCAGVRRENDVLKCLDSRRVELSTICTSYFQKLGTRPIAQKNVPNKKPPLPSTPAANPPANNNLREPGPG